SSPTIASQSLSVAENSNGGTVVGTVVASDPDVGQTLTYAITGGNEVVVGGNTVNAFTIDHDTGVIKVSSAAAMDFETNPSFSLTVTVTDSGSPPLSKSALVTVNLDDVNETPGFVSSGPFNVNEHSATGTPVGTVAATDPDAGQKLTYSILSGN